MRLPYKTMFCIDKILQIIYDSYIRFLNSPKHLYFKKILS